MEQRLIDALNAQRKKWYGDGWELLNWWGLPINKQPTLGRK